MMALAGQDVGYGRAREWLGDGYYKVVIEYQEEEVGRATMESARELIMAAINDTPYDVPAEVAKLRDLSLRVALVPSTRAIVDAAQTHKKPIRRLNDGSLVQLGYGCK